MQNAAVLSLCPDWKNAASQFYKGSQLVILKF